MRVDLLAGLFEDDAPLKAEQDAEQPEKQKAPMATADTTATAVVHVENIDDFLGVLATPAATAATTSVACVLDTELLDEMLEPLHQEVEAGMEPEPIHQAPELPYLSSGMLMTNQVTGKPLHCIHCGRWHHTPEHAWWVGTCDLCNEQKTNKSRCSIVSVEWITEQSYSFRDEE